MTANISIDMRISNLTTVANYFQRDVTTFSRGLRRMLSNNRDELNHIREWIENTLMQAKIKISMRRSHQ